MAPDRSKAGGNRNRPDILTDPRAIQRVHLDHHQISSHQNVVKTIKDTPITDLADVEVDKTSDDFAAGQSLVWGGDSWIAGDPEVLVPVKAAEEMTKGTPVYVSDEHTSGKPIVSKADSDGTDTYPAIGLLLTDLASGEEGHAVGGGILSGLDTSSYTAGDALYLSSSPGVLTSTRPTATNEKVQKVAVVARSHGSAGTVIVMGAGRTNDIPNDLVTLTGVTLGDSDLGTFTGTTIADNETIKGALQDLETAVETGGGVKYHNRYDTEASTQRAAGDVTPLTCEVYYTARPDGDGYAESEETATPPSGARIVRRLYYSDKFNADPTVGADWTAYTSQPADGTSFANAKASLLAGLNDTDATANTRGTLPVSLKMEYEAVLNRLLNDYPGAEAAYSVRLIDKNYSGYCMRVRNVNTNATADIGFDTDGNLDEAAIATLCGSYNGVVEIWYDQSGGGHHQIQETTTLQPRIYLGSAGAVLKENGKPVIVFIDGGQLQNVSHSTITVNIMTGFNSTSPNPGYTFSVVGPGTDYSSQPNFYIGTTDSLGTRMGLCMNFGTASPDSNMTCTHTVNQTTQSSPTTLSLYTAVGSQAVVTTEWVSTSTGTNRWYINYNNSFTGNLQVQEYVIYYSDKSSDQAAIEDAINGYYGAYI